MSQSSYPGKDKGYLDNCQVPLDDLGDFGSILRDECLNCRSGISCRKCRKFGTAPGGPSRLVLYSSESPENYSLQKWSFDEVCQHKRARYVVRANSGVICGLVGGYRFRWFTLTESDEAISAGLDFGRAFNQFITWLRYYCPDFQYQVVEHRQGVASAVSGEPRLNRHILSYGSDKLPLLAMESQWQRCYLSSVSRLSEVKNLDKTVKYLAGYLGSGEKFIRSWSSQGWVFKGWLNFSRAFKLKWDDYPARSVLVFLKGLSAPERQSEIEFLLETGCRSCEVLK